MAIALIAPTLLVSLAWIASAFTGNMSHPLPPPDTWRWHISPNYFLFERTAPAVPVASLPRSSVPPQFGPPPINGFASSGRDHFFGWLKIYHELYFTGMNATPSRTIRISFIIPLLLTLPLAILAARRWHRETVWRRRHAHRFCAKCGYDLRGSPNRCPECGTVPQR